ncbi:division/cell wall cluster transcriptional repressor MraZ [Microbacter margulisiae]|uniref:Transcriptional regulator MraZ n=1 Tax=Microbacter margulisiae TaxID=1350067 RepID=A0A7W5H1C2_9PORP|nr:division/cell wall cluster transcriptional repressor MraZ [Microbacter margulisiae]MBB3187428.1 MraZ protein [Microbacter margulisiae]
MYGFIGNSEAKADVKGRIFIPAHYRKALAENENSRLVMRKDPYNNSLVFYPESIWNEKLRLLKQELNEWNPTHQLLLMQYVAEAEELDIDSQGRVLISKKYLNLIGVESDVLFVGMLDTFALWSKESFEKAKYSPAEFSHLLQSILSASTQKESH